ncbi:glycosyltransferase family 2 protein [Thermodesulfobacteriota bacterium]
MAKEHTTFSVIVPAFNTSDYIDDALKSVLNQTYKNWEVIIVDDGSTDNTWEKIQRWQPKLNERLIAVRRPFDVKHSASIARNIAIHMASGEFVAFLDSDDIWVPEHLDRALKSFRHYGKRVGLFCGLGQFMGKTSPNIVTGWPDDKPCRPISNLLNQPLCPLPSVCIRKDLIQSLGGFNETLKCYEDWWLYLLLSKRTDFIHYPKVTCFIRQRRESATTVGSRMSKAMYGDALKLYWLAKKSNEFIPQELKILRSNLVDRYSKQLSDNACAFRFGSVFWIISGLLGSGLKGIALLAPIISRGILDFLKRGLVKALSHTILLFFLFLIR